LAALLALDACIPHGAPAPRRPAPGSAETLQCHVDLAREGVRFRVLPDQRFAGGCSALGAVLLVDIGIPVTNLGAMTCPLARQFARWSQGPLQAAAAQYLGTRVTRIESFGTYACRTRDSRAGAPLSEHAFANAVDVAAFQLADGRRLSVQADWRGGDEAARRFLRAAFQAGCRAFSIGLSPDADADHYNHMHFDLGRGPYCR
jgi:hypothetical protein